MSPLRACVWWWWWWCVCAVGVVLTAVVPPPWADPLINPCAAQPRGWQMLYWPPDGQCYKIFQKGYPCPPSMELSPGPEGAQCSCPPRSLHLRNSSACHEMFTRGPCPTGQHIKPVYSKLHNESRLGECSSPALCADPTQLLWPADGRCYRRLSRGPCTLGTLLTQTQHQTPNCTCSAWGPTAGHVWAVDGACYEHYARGPCPDGRLFLAGGGCGCAPYMPHYHNLTGACYQIDTSGPCSRGHVFSLSSESPERAQCRCKRAHLLWRDGACYRAYTRGPCPTGHLLAPPARCVPLPCRKSRLYFPQQKRCYKVGSRGPCDSNQLVLYDFEARPSIDGVAYNGVCSCKDPLNIDAINSNCTINKINELECNKSPGMVAIAGMCHMLYTRGPCGDGQWLIPRNTTQTDRNMKDFDTTECACKPGYTKYSETFRGGSDKDSCFPPTVTLAKYLNNKYTKS